MKIHLRADSANGVHTKVTVFLNGANCGQLTMGDAEAVNFLQIIELGCASTTGIDELRDTGRWAAPEENPHAQA